MSLTEAIYDCFPFSFKSRVVNITEIFILNRRALNVFSWISLDISVGFIVTQYEIIIICYFLIYNCVLYCFYK